MIDPKKKNWKWGPIDGQVIYIDDFMEMMVACKKLTGISWSDCLVHIKESKVVFISEFDALYECGENMFRSYILDLKKRTKFYDAWLVAKDKIVELIDCFTAEDLKKMTNQELFFFIKDFYTIYGQFWSHGLIPEIANFGGEKLLKSHIESKYPAQVIDILEVLSAPEELSFYQIEELDLLRLKLEKKPLEEHQKKYFWLENSYGSVKIADIKSFQERIDMLSDKEAKSKIKEIEHFPKKTKAKKKGIIKKYSIASEVQTIASGLSFSIWWQDYRKKFIFMALHMITCIIRELGRRYAIKFKELLLYSRKNVFELAETKKRIDNLKDRKLGFISFYDAENNDGFNLVGKEANDLISQYTNLTVVKNVKEIKGLVVSKGKVSGKVRLLSGARHFDSFREGEILVTAMTSPEFIVAMRKAKAIVTDEGGMTCHAAIVSRELGVPCIVATKIATRALTTGEMVEVDAEKGIIRKIK